MKNFYLLLKCLKNILGNIYFSFPGPCKVRNFFSPKRTCPPKADIFFLLKKQSLFFHLLPSPIDTKILLGQLKPTRWGYKELYAEMGRRGSVCVLCVKALREWSLSVQGGIWGAVQLCWDGGRCWGSPGVLWPCCMLWYHPAAAPRGIVGTHQTWAKLSFRLQGRHSWCFWTCFLFIVMNHKGTSNTVQRNGNGERRFAHCSCYSK